MGVWCVFETKKNKKKKDLDVQYIDELGRRLTKPNKAVVGKEEGAMVPYREHPFPEDPDTDTSSDNDRSDDHSNGWSIALTIIAFRSRGLCRGSHA